MAVIVRSTADAVASAERLVVALGGRIDLELGIINGFRAYGAGQLTCAPGTRPAIWSITPDSAVHMNAVDSHPGLRHR